MMSVRVLYSFPHKLGVGRISTTAWEQVNGIVAAGARVTVWPAALSKALPDEVSVQPTLAIRRARVPFKLMGSMRAFMLHDWIVARRLRRVRNDVDIIHVWPLGALKTLQVAAELGIPAVLERPNAHTRYAYSVVKAECERLGVALPPDHEHAWKDDVLVREEAEYDLATRLLCPSDFVRDTFLQHGFGAGRLARHQYGFDDRIFYPSSSESERRGLTMLFVGGCAPRKGLHFALKAWLSSPARENGQFLIAGEFVPGYAEVLAPMLAHDSVRVLGQRSDVADLMRSADVLTLPSIEEGSALVTSEARGSGCVLLVSDAAGAVCKHMENGLVHRAGDVAELTDHIAAVHRDPALLARLRDASLRTADQITWRAAGRRLVDVYHEVMNGNCGSLGVSGAVSV